MVKEVISPSQIFRKMVHIESDASWISYDLYDGATSPLLRGSPLLQTISTYLNKFSPVNFRPILGIKKRVYLHALANVVEALATSDSLKANEIHECLPHLERVLLNASLREVYGDDCWNGLGIPVRMLRGSFNPGECDIIACHAVGHALCALAEIKLTPERKEVLNSLRQHLLNTHLRDSDLGPYLSYKCGSQESKLYVINASALGASILARIDCVLRDNTNGTTIDSIVQTIVNAQSASGCWPYSIALDARSSTWQTDFHQCYILTSLMELEIASGTRYYENAIRQGLDYFNTSQLDEVGAVAYRLPKRLPFNVHSQLCGYFTNRLAQGYFAGEMVGNYQAFGDLIWRRTVEKLWDPKLGFIYGRYGAIPIRIGHTRWGNSYALMMLARLMKLESRKNETIGIEVNS